MVLHLGRPKRHLEARICGAATHNLRWQDLRTFPGSSSPKGPPFGGRAVGRSEHADTHQLAGLGPTGARRSRLFASQVLLRPFPSSTPRGTSRLRPSSRPECIMRRASAIARKTSLPDIATRRPWRSVCQRILKRISTPKRKLRRGWPCAGYRTRPQAFGAAHHGRRKRGSACMRAWGKPGHDQPAQTEAARAVTGAARLERKKNLSDGA